MMKSLKILSHTVRTDSEGRFCLNDCHKASGQENSKRPSIWMKTQQSQELIDELSLSKNSCLALKVQKGGTNPGTYACRELVYAYAMWINPKFHLAVIRAFDALVSNEARRAQIPHKGSFSLQEAPLLSKDEFRESLVWEIDSFAMPNSQKERLRQNIKNLSDDYLKSILSGIIHRGTKDNFQNYLVALFKESSLKSGDLTLYAPPALCPPVEIPKLLGIRQASKKMNMNEREFSSLLIHHGFASRNKERRLVPTKTGIRENVALPLHGEKGKAYGIKIPEQSLPFLKRLPVLLG